jgi:HEAT repeat protein
MHMLDELNNEKGDAAVYGLARLGGPDVIEGLKDKLRTTSGQIQYRVITCLFRLNDPLGKQLLIQQLEKFPTLAPEAAILLARDGNWDASRFLVKRLKSRYDEKEDVMAYRARAAAALVANVDPTAVSYLQDLLGVDNVPTKKLVCTLLAELAKGRLIPVLQPTLENGEADVALQACFAVVAIAKQEFRDRFLEYQQ